MTGRHTQNVSWKETGNLTLVIPHPRHGKNPETYNYPGHDSIVAIEEEIEIMLKAELHSMMQKNKYQKGIMYEKSLILFMQKYHIDDIDEDEIILHSSIKKQFS